MKKNVRIRHSCCVNLVLYLIGIILMPVGVVMTIMSGLGAGGYDAWNFALAGLLGQPVSSGIYISSVCVILKLLHHNDDFKGVDIAFTSAGAGYHDLPHLLLLFY